MSLESYRYLFLVGYDKTTSNLSTKTAEASVIFTDGTMKNVEVKFNDTNDNIKKAKNGEYVALDTDGEARYNRWFKYSTDKNDVYTLDVVDHMITVDSAKAKDISVKNVRLVCSVTGCGNKAWGNDDSVYMTVEAKANATDNGAAITKVKGVYTGVQNVSLKVDTTNVGDLNESVFAVADNDGYIIAAVVRGTEGSASNTYAYAVKGAQNEYVLGDDDYYYWDFKAVHEGEYKTMTVKTEYKNVISAIQGVVDKDALGEPALLKLTLDNDGYITDVEILEDADEGVYGKTEFLASSDIDPKDFDVYLVQHTVAKTLKAFGRTLYADFTNTTDVGLTLASGAPVIVLQEDADGNYSVEEYTSIAQALDAVEDSDNYKGVIAAALNDKGTAEFIVLSSATKLSPTGKDDGKNKSGLTLDSMSYDHIDEQFVVSFTTKGEIDDGTEYTITITNKDGGKLLTQDGKIANKVGAGETGTVTADYTAVSGTGTYIVTVEIGKLSASETLIVA